MPATRERHVHRPDTCATDGCDEAVFACGLCAPCYQWDYYWTRKKNAGERRAYVKRMDRLSNRVEVLRPATTRLRIVS